MVACLHQRAGNPADETRILGDRDPGVVQFRLEFLGRRDSGHVADAFLLARLRAGQEDGAVELRREVLEHAVAQRLERRLG